MGYKLEFQVSVGLIFLAVDKSGSSSQTFNDTHFRYTYPACPPEALRVDVRL